MHLPVRIQMNAALYLRDPESTELGKKIIQHSILLIHQNGFEAFTFKKLAEEIKTTEASIYRYFENKHRLLVYLVAWYWSWLGLQIQYEIHNIQDPKVRLEKIIVLLASTVQDDASTSHVNESLLHQIVISEGSKSYLTNHVGEDNRQQFFKPYKDLCAAIGAIILAHNSSYRYPRSLASTMIEMAHFQNYFMHHLPSLTDFGTHKEETEIISYLTDLLFSSIGLKDKPEYCPPALRIGLQTAPFSRNSVFST